jgi:hypothetical protein
MGRLSTATEAPTSISVVSFDFDIFYVAGSLDQTVPRTGIRQYGPDNETTIIWEERMDSKVQLLTPNTTVVYVFLWLNLEEINNIIQEEPVESQSPEIQCRDVRQMSALDTH